MNRNSSFTDKFATDKFAEDENARESAAGVSARPMTNVSNDSRSLGSSEQRRKELADFLRTRRERIKPEQVGLSQGLRRRTPGLRREEVAELAGVGTTWYTWLEQARDIQPSTEVLRRLGAALQLTQAEVRHMFALAGKAAPLDFESQDQNVIATVKRFLDESISVPGVLVGSRWDILAFNQQAAEAFAGLNQLPENKRNWLYLVFCRPEARESLLNWEQNARRLVGEFRASLGEAVDNPWVLEVVNDLKNASPEFAQWWREHDVRENAAIVLEVKQGSEVRRYERMVVRPFDHTPFRILLFNKV